MSNITGVSLTSESSIESLVSYPYGNMKMDDEGTQLVQTLVDL